MSVILSTIVLLASAVSSAAESNQIFKAIDQDLNLNFHQIHQHQNSRQNANLHDLQAKNPPCDPVRCY